MAPVRPAALTAPRLRRGLFVSLDERQEIERA
jgi:hypothetical protein